MRLLIAAPVNLLRTSHIVSALEQASVEPEELLLPADSKGSTDLWLRDWARKHDISIVEFTELEQAWKLMERAEDKAVVAVVSPDHPETLDLVSTAESRRIPVFIYRELYRQDPRVNCRFSPVERPDTWLRALTAEQRDFFRRLHTLCQQYQVELRSTQSAEGGSLLTFADGTEFEGIDLASEACRVRPRGSFRYRKIPLDS